MCTVTFIPSEDKVFLTSNRDEKVSRSKAIYPFLYIHKETAIMYPKDPDAGGSWIGMNVLGNAAVLLNGGIAKHTSIGPYAKSRGLIFLEIIGAIDPLEEFTKIELHNIEPFTIILYQDTKLFELIWDSNQKYCNQLNARNRYIWSSVTLYTTEIIELRKKWFEDWNSNQRNPSQIDILDFHKFTGDGNSEHNLLMSKESNWNTVSISGMTISKSAGEMIYLDVIDEDSRLNIVEFSQSKLLANHV